MAGIQLHIFISVMIWLANGIAGKIRVGGQVQFVHIRRGVYLPLVRAMEAYFSHLALRFFRGQQLEYFLKFTV